MVQWGAMVGSQTGRFCRVTKAQLQTLARAGAAAGISAVFRSPAGSVLLTLEIFGAGFDRDLPAIAIASGIGYLVRITILGDAYPFRPLQTLVPLSIATTVIVLPLMGVIAAYTGHLFIMLFERRDKVLPARWPLWFRVTLGGAMVGFIAIWFPQILSAGYPTIRLGIDGHYGFWIFVVLLLLKMLATTITFGSGAVGGTFCAHPGDRLPVWRRLRLRPARGFSSGRSATRSLCSAGDDRDVRFDRERLPERIAHGRRLQRLLSPSAAWGLIAGGIASSAWLASARQIDFRAVAGVTWPGPNRVK